MELWLDATNTDSNSLPEGASRVWDGRAPDVAEVALSDYRGQDEARSLVGMVPWILVGSRICWTPASDRYGY